MICYQCMQGKNILWQVGIDYVGIVIQMVVECKIVVEEGKICYDYGCEVFIDKIWEWKVEFGGMIICQMCCFGNFVDWECECFIMDEGLFNVVKEVFVCLYKEDLIYCGKCLVNWDLKLCIVIFDLEVENCELKGLMWYICYLLVDGVKIVDGKDYLVVVIICLEILLGDIGVVVNLEDLCYKDLIGKYVILLLVNCCILIVGDEYVDMEKGIGCVKIILVYDFNDYEVGKCYVLLMINILIFDGDICESVQVFDIKGNEFDVYFSEIFVEFQKLECFVVCKVVVVVVDVFGLLEEIKLYDLIVFYGDCGGVVIELMLIDQWYVCVDVLVKLVVEVVENGDIQFVLKQYENMYFFWMCDIQDWCIFCQLWWGYCILVWYDEVGNVYVGCNEDEVCKENNFGVDVVLCQDEDVFDIWFFFVLWIFFIFGWLENIDVLCQFYLISVMVFGFDIIFFWIVCMIMMIMYFIKDENGKLQVLFYIVYMIGLICDDEGQKMFKFKGNVIDLLDMVDGILLLELLEKCIGNMMQLQLVDKICKCIEKQFLNGIELYGIDVLCFILVVLVFIGCDINWDMKCLEGYCNFCNKLWNVSCFVLMNIEGQDCGFNGGEMMLLLVDCWILVEFNQIIKVYCEVLDSFCFDIVVGILYEFIWNQFCDWYFELIKLVMNGGIEVELCGICYMLVIVLEGLLCFVYLIILFIIEIIWQCVKVFCGIIVDIIMLQLFLQYDVFQVDEVVLVDIEWLKQVIVVVCNICVEMNIVLGKLLELLLCGCSVDVECCVNENCGFL